MTTPSPVFISTPHEGICLITLNRPEKRNALDGALIQQWTTLFDKIESDASIRLVLLNANGEHFCAGADIAWMQKMARASHEENISDALQLARLLQSIQHCSKPVIGLVQGAIMGGGLGVIACCDMVIAATNAVFCFSEVKIGLTPSVISPFVVPIIGERAARYYFLTAEKFNAEKAMALNLVQQIVPLEKLMDAGLALAKTCLSNSPHALSEVKKLLSSLSNETVIGNITKFTANHLAKMRASSEAKEGLNAFLEKRNPIWK
ncbi:MAG TPA: enoyl-CoA hydratase-related protein [Gammaproteobacteria bacterium]|nr:enoyl-CoA hydratase-related protein [Gammaproteobacteria bacterium]